MMKNIEDLLDAVQENSDWSSDYKIGRGLGYTHTAQVSGWRRKMAMPSIEDIAAMADHANLDLGECVRAVIYSKQNERPLKQAAGFIDLNLLMGFGGLSLVGVGALHTSPILLGLTAIGCGGIYIMRSKAMI